MKYRAENFSEEERNSIIQLGKIVAYVFKINEDELRSHVRKREFTDARKALSSIASSNIDVASSERFKQWGYNMTSLTSWYLNCDHSSISYSVDKAGELYEVDKNFKFLYDSIIELINKPSEEVLNKIELAKNEMDELTWDEVKDNVNFTHKVRYSVAPEEVLLDIEDLYSRGYSVALIANKYKMMPTFVGYVSRIRGLERKEKHKLFLTANQLIHRRKAIIAPEVKTLHTVDY